MVFIHHPALLLGLTILSASISELVQTSINSLRVILLFSPLFFSVLLNLVDERALAGVLSAIK